ncbi:MAG TPA: GNAT family N-acetyltransferase [Gemmatimonadales bacterium]
MTSPLRALVASLRDGTPVLVRPVRPADAPLLREGFERLSDLSRYRRFLRPVKELSDAQLRYFTEIDYRDHMAWLAVDLSQPSRPGVGIARYIRCAHRPTVAEVAVTVVDTHQGKGLGTLLLGRLALSAVENGIDTWVAYVLTENTPMLELFRDLGATEAKLEEPGVMRVEIPVPPDPSQLPHTPAGKVFRAVARVTSSARKGIACLIT